MLRGFNATAAAYPQDACVHELVAAQAAATPDAPALEWRGDAMSYAELHACAARVAAWLRAHGVAPDCVVALQLSRSLEQVVGVYGTLLSGGAYLPLGPAWPLAPSARSNATYGQREKNWVPFSPDGTRLFVMQWLEPRQARVLQPPARVAGDSAPLGVPLEGALENLGGSGRAARASHARGRARGVAPRAVAARARAAARGRRAPTQAAAPRPRRRDRGVDV